MISTLTETDAAQLAIDFLLSDLEFAEDDREWLSILSCRLVGESWYVAEVGIEGLPDKWVIQVYDTGECDPSYTFSSPIKTGTTDDLEEMPESIARVLASERLTLVP